MEEMQAIMREREEKIAELSTLRDSLDEERRRAEQLQEEFARSHEMEQSERDKLVKYFPL